MTDAKKKYVFFVDAAEFKTEHAQLTGAQIRAFVPGAAPTYQLYLEEPGDQPDRQVPDTEVVHLDEHGVRKFYLVPPATFGK